MFIDRKLKIQSYQSSSRHLHAEYSDRLESGYDENCEAVNNRFNTKNGCQRKIDIRFFV